MKREEKQKEAEALHEELEKARTVILSGFEGTTVSQDTELRRKLAGAGAKYQVVKNSLIERAAKGTQAEPVAQKLRGTTSLAFTRADPVSLAKALTAYAKENPTLVFKAGVVEGRVVALKDLELIASLPPREELFAKVLYLLNSPAQRLASTLSGVARNLAFVIQQAVKEKKFSADDRAAESAAPHVPREAGHRGVFEDLKSAINSFLRTLPNKESIPGFDEAILQICAGSRFAPGANTPEMSQLVSQLADPKREELKQYYLESVGKIQKNSSEEISGGD